jgi:hypothetical protein
MLEHESEKTPLERGVMDWQMEQSCQAVLCEGMQV